MSASSASGGASSAAVRTMKPAFSSASKPAATVLRSRSRSTASSIRADTPTPRLCGMYTR